MGETPITFIKPWKHDVNAMADTGANMNAISMAIDEKMYNKYIKMRGNICSPWWIYILS